MYMIPDECYQILFEALGKRSIDSIASAAYQIFNMPIVVTDVEFIVLAKYPNKPFSDEQWDANVVGQQIEPRFVATFSDDDHFAHHAQAARPILIDWGHYKNAPRLTAVISSPDGEIFGYFSALTTNCVVEEWHYDAAELVAQAFFLEMDAYLSRRANRRDNFSAALYALLNGSISSRADLMLLPEKFQELFQPPYILVCAQTKNPFNAPLRAYFGERIVRAFPHAVQTVQENSLYILVGSVPQDYRTATGFIDTIKQLDSEQVIFGVSHLFDNLLSAPDFKWQAEQALRVGSIVNPKAIVHDYEDHILNVAMDILTSSMPATAMNRPGITKLRRRDLENGTEYFHTLGTYVLNNYDKHKTAEELCIHRNTLQYRLERICEVLEIRNSEIENSQFLRLYFLLLEYRRKRDSAAKNNYRCQGGAER